MNVTSLESVLSLINVFGLGAVVLVGGCVAAYAVAKLLLAKEYAVSFDLKFDFGPQSHRAKTRRTC
jgi:hypothetical protein